MLVKMQMQILAQSENINRIINILEYMDARILLLEKKDV